MSFKQFLLFEETYQFLLNSKSLLLIEEAINIWQWTLSFADALTRNKYPFLYSLLRALTHS